MNKLYSSLSQTEKEQWLVDFREWLSVSFPKVEQIKTLSADVRAIAEQGLGLINAFPYCRSFVRESFAAKDYHRRMRTLRRYADKVAADIQKELQVTVDLTNPALLVPHVGRPTREESAARAIAKQKKADEDKKTSLFPDHDEVANVEHPIVVAPIVPTANRLPALSQLRWLMSPSLQEAADSIRALRSRFEEYSTRAKQMAEDGSPEAEIKPLAQQAIADHDLIESIYQKIDNEMATVYVRLKEDSAYIEEMSKLSNMSPVELRTWLRPYWDKVEDKDAKKQQVIDFIKANDPAQAAIRIEKEKIQQRARAIIKQLRRKDRKNSARRLNTMEEQLEELTSLIGDDAKPYYAFFIAAREDYEQNILPKEKAKKALKVAKKLAAKNDN